MILPKLMFSLSTLLLLAFYACGGGGAKAAEKAKLQNEQLQGSWEVTEAERNGMPTETLQGLFFRFTDHNQMTTNLLGSDMENTYEISNDKILQKGTPPVEYTIETLATEKMVLKTTLQGFDFKLVLQKVAQ